MSKKTFLQTIKSSAITSMTTMTSCKNAPLEFSPSFLTRELRMRSRFLVLTKRSEASGDENELKHSRPQRPRSFWSAPRIATSGRVQHRKSTIHGLHVTLRMLRVKSDKSDWFQLHSIVFAKPIRTGISLDPSRGRDSWC